VRRAQNVDVLAEGSAQASRSSDSPVSAARRAFPLLLIFVVVVVLDQTTKWWAEARLEPYNCLPDGSGCIELIGSLRFFLVYNPGASFSVGSGLGPVFGVLAAVMAVVALVIAYRETNRFVRWLLAMVAAGAVGNLIDRIFRADGGFLSGEVVDFIDLQWWPIFNIADMAVVGGIIGFIGYSFLRPDQPVGQPSTISRSDMAAVSKDHENEDDTDVGESSSGQGQ